MPLASVASCRLARAFEHDKYANPVTDKSTRGMLAVSFHEVSLDTVRLFRFLCSVFDFVQKDWSLVVFTAKWRKSLLSGKCCRALSSLSITQSCL